MSVVGALLAIGFGSSSVDWTAEVLDFVRPHPAAQESRKVSTDAHERIERLGSDGINLPVRVFEKMDLTTARVASATHAINLPSFQGVLALDNDRLTRVYTRFAGEIVEMGKSTDGSDPTLRVGERVKRGDLLAVIWSTELGKKKSELVDALTKLRAEEQLRNRLKKLFEDGAGTGRSYHDAEKDVQSRLVEIASLERTLSTWRITEADLAAVRAEANRLAKADELSEASMPESKIRNWARVEVRAPIDGVILEKNAVVGEIVGTENDLFKVGDLSHLAVWAHVYEEDLPLLESIPHPINWTVTLLSQPNASFSGKLEKVGAVIDPTQHTALVTGQVDNQNHALKIGQFVTVSVQLPSSEQEMVLPATAVIEDGRQSVVFIQPDHKEPRFLRRPVHVLRRFRDEIYVQADSGGVKPGDVIVTSGALMLHNAIERIALPAEKPSKSAARLRSSASKS